MGLFQQINSGARQGELQFLVIGGLIALKLHALKYAHAARFLKDFLDVENLLRVNKVDLHSDNVRQLSGKYGAMDLYEKVSKAFAGG